MLARRLRPTPSQRGGRTRGKRGRIREAGGKVRGGRGRNRGQWVCDDREIATFQHDPFDASAGRGSSEEVR